MSWIMGSLRWLDERLGFSDKILPVIQHPVPRDVNWWYVFGSATLVAFIVQVITGVALAFTYVPAPDSAYASLQFISQQALLGSIVRGIHFWGASAMVILIFIHMVRVFLMGSYKYPRELNWITGVLLFVLTLGMAFSGQLLRWNQDAYWAIVVSAEQAGRVPIVGPLLVQILVAGQTVGGATLTRFYATHVFLFPALIFALIGIHLYLVVRHGISEPPKAGEIVDPATYNEKYEQILQHNSVPFWPDAAWRDVAFALGVGMVVLALAIWQGPPDLGKVADPTVIQADPRPDWYFIWYFAVLALTPPSVENWVIVGFPLAVGVILIALPFVAPAGERSPRRRPWAVGTVMLVILGIGTLVHLGFDAPWSPVLEAQSLPTSVTANLQGPAAQGAQLFDEKDCHACHSMDGTGGSRGPDLTHVGSRLDAVQMTTRILAGGTNMPAFGSTLQPDELQDLVAFLQAQT